MSAHASSIETRYLSGSYIDGVATERLVDALLADLENATSVIWLKRNPVQTTGATHITQLIQAHKMLQLLDLHNT